MHKNIFDDGDTSNAKNMIKRMKKHRVIDSDRSTDDSEAGNTINDSCDTNSDYIRNKDHGIIYDVLTIDIKYI